MNEVSWSSTTAGSTNTICVSYSPVPVVTPVFERDVWRMIGEAFERYGNGEPLYRGCCIVVNDHPICVTGLLRHAIIDLLPRVEQQLILLRRITGERPYRNPLPSGKRAALQRAMYCYLLAEDATP